MIKERRKELKKWKKYMKAWFEEKKILRKENEIKLLFLNKIIENYKKQIEVVTKQIELNNLSYEKGKRHCKKVEKELGEKK